MKLHRKREYLQSVVHVFECRDNLREICPYHASRELASILIQVKNLLKCFNVYRARWRRRDLERIDLSQYRQL